MNISSYIAFQENLSNAHKTLGRFKNKIYIQYRDATTRIEDLGQFKLKLKSLHILPVCLTYSITTSLNSMGSTIVMRSARNVIGMTI